MRVLTAEQMRAVDRRAIDELGLPGMVLMENAAVGAVDALVDVFPHAETIAIFCGPGNNGGDGLAMARHLDARGFQLEIFLVGSKPPAGDAGTQLEVLENAGRRIQKSLGADCTDRDVELALHAAARCDVVVDALFGTGLSRPLEGVFATLVERLDALGVPILAVDLPSGLDSSRSKTIGPHLHADLTVTFAAPKVAQVLMPAARAVGRVVVIDLGIPPELIIQAPSSEQGTWHLLTRDELTRDAALFGLGRATSDAHKGTFGHLLIAAGGPGTSGAAVLTTRAALRTGAGLVTLAVPEALAESVDSASLESMTLGLAAGSTGDVSRFGGAAALEALLEAAHARDAVALGPGIGTDPATVEWVRQAVIAIDRPLVLDADGLNALADEPQLLRQRSAATVLTPHPGEAARLLGTSAADVQDDRPSAALELARLTGCVVVLKGELTLIATTEDKAQLWINPTGNPGMATGGSGDVLTGVIGALLAQGYDALDAARLGVYVHGDAGDRAAEVEGRAGLIASDIVAALGASWRQLEES